jgi:hypothetical protein
MPCKGLKHEVSMAYSEHDTFKEARDGVGGREMSLGGNMQVRV